VEVLHSEKEVLEEAAANANSRMQENREALAAQTKQLGQLHYLPPRLQDMQEQVCTSGEPESQTSGVVGQNFTLRIRCPLIHCTLLHLAVLFFFAVVHGSLQQIKFLTAAGLACACTRLHLSNLSISAVLVCASC